MSCQPFLSAVSSTVVPIKKIWVTPGFWKSAQEERCCRHVMFHPHYFPLLTSSKQEIVLTKTNPSGLYNECVFTRIERMCREKIVYMSPLNISVRNHI